MVCAALLAFWESGPVRHSTRATVQVARKADAERSSAHQPYRPFIEKAVFLPRVENDSSVQAAGVDAPIVALASTQANVRLDAVSDLGLVKDAQTESLLAITALQDAEPSVRAEALYNLGALRAESQLATVQLAITDPDPAVRKAAIGALQDMGGAASAQILRTALGDADAAIRMAAAEALREIDAQ